MDPKELFDTLRQTINFNLEKTDKGIWVGGGAINMCPECAGMTRLQYDIHYGKAKNTLESLPWTGKVEHPRSPQPGEYPTEDGEYITMLDADEHYTLINTFRDGHWSLYDRTHVKWWMPLPDMEGVEPFGRRKIERVVEP